MAGTIELLLPGVPTVDKKGALSPRLQSLGGKTVYLINNDWLSLDVTYEVIKPILLGQYEVAHIVEKRKPGRSGLLSREDTREVLSNADAVISGLGN